MRPMHLAFVYLTIVFMRVNFSRKITGLHKNLSTVAKFIVRHSSFHVAGSVIGWIYE